jgi:hypothetical protein
MGLLVALGQPPSSGIAVLANHSFVLMSRKHVFSYSLLFDGKNLLPMLGSLYLTVLIGHATVVAQPSLFHPQVREW